MVKRFDKVSIIVPVYNAYREIDRCIQSILSQTYDNLELLLIDDGSTDGSGQKCDYYAQKDTRVKVYHKPNAGVSAARNLGLANATGEWILFVDADDYIEYNHLSLLCDNLDADMILSAFQFEYVDRTLTKQLRYDELYIDANNLSEVLMDAAYMVPWAKLFRRSIIEHNNILFNERIHQGEDSLFVFTYLLHTQKVRATKDITYHYCITDTGLSKKKLPIEEILYSLDCFYVVLKEHEARWQGYDMSHRYIWLVFEKFVMILKYINAIRNWKCRYNKLIQVLNDRHIRALIKDNDILPKGFKRRFWDNMAIKERYIILAFYLYLYQYD